MIALSLLLLIAGGALMAALALSLWLLSYYERSLTTAGSVVWTVLVCAAAVTCWVGGLLAGLTL